MTFEYGNWKPIIEWFEKIDKMSAFPDHEKFAMYKEGHVFDEEKSVKWNREEVKRKNKEYKEELKRLIKEHKEEFDLAKDTVISLIADKLKTILPGADAELIHPDNLKKKADLIFANAWEKRHSYGMHEVLTEVEELVDFIDDFMKVN